MSEGGRGDETTGKKGISLQRAMTKKVVSFFWEKNRWHYQLPPRVTPTLVTSLMGVYWTQEAYVYRFHKTSRVLLS